MAFEFVGGVRGSITVLRLLWLLASGYIAKKEATLLIPSSIIMYQKLLQITFRIIFRIYKGVYKIGDIII